MFQVSALTEMMREMGLGDDITNAITSFTNGIFELSWRSGIQILLFIAGLQTVPPQLYEAANVDGCTAWERFWKITFPLLTPVLIINLIYTVTDHFTSYQNEVMRMILDYGSSFKYSYSATLAWIYFAVILVILGGLYAVTNRRVVYYS
jgi:ABC-type sugar transport system permease subunit